MKKLIILTAALALVAGSAFSQGMLDAYRYSMTDLNGTARYLSMGGAFGALGGDISAMNGNPAGLAVYHSSEIVATMSVNNVSTDTKWFGNSTTTDNTRVNFDNVGYVGYFPTGSAEGVTGFNFGFSYNRLKNFRRSYKMAAGGSLNTSLTDYVASRAYGINSNDLVSGTGYDPYANQDWLSVLGYNAGFMDSYNDNSSTYYSSFGDFNTSGEWVPYGLDDAQLQVNEKGSIDLYQISFGFDVSNIFLFGATVGITDMNYHYQSSYDEKFSNDNDIYLDNYLKTDGTGYNFKVGAIFKPIDYLRFGVAYSSPTWYKLTDYYYAEAGSYLTYQNSKGETEERSLKANSPDNDAYTDYQYRAPDKWLFSAAAIFGQTGLLSVDYEYTNYDNMKLYDNNGNTNSYIDANNTDIKNYFHNQNTLRVGAEVRVTPQFSVRAGAAWSQSAAEDNLKDRQVIVNTVGTIPNYTVPKDLSDYSIGLGYRFTPRCYLDAACVFRTYKEDVYAFSYIDGADYSFDPATMKTHTTRFALTLGYKF